MIYNGSAVYINIFLAGEEKMKDTKEQFLTVDKVKSRHITLGVTKMVYCRTGFMKEYNGITSSDKLINGGSYVIKNGTGSEIYNFHEEPDGYIYGFFEPKQRNGNSMQIKLENIDKKFKGKDSAENIFIVMCATPSKGGTCIVGYYKNATIYRHLQHYGSRLYNIKVKAQNAFLIPVLQRYFLISKTNCGFCFGRSNIRYVGNQTFNEKVIKYLNTGFIIGNNDENLNKYYEESGVPVTITVNAYERNLKARAEYIKKYGTKCRICGFDASVIYGKDYSGKIEIHHIVPISERDENYTLNIDKDLIAVCPNCHMILHTPINGKCISVEDLKKILN